VSFKALLARGNPTGVSGRSAGPSCDDASAAGDEDVVVAAAPDLALRGSADVAPDAAVEPDALPERDTSVELDAPPERAVLEDANAAPLSALDGDTDPGVEALLFFLAPPRPAELAAPPFAAISA
jgi:hypothetical protein